MFYHWIPTVLLLLLLLRNKQPSIALSVQP
jgi:hypothetical protein